MAKTDSAFPGAVAEFYDRYLAGMFVQQSDALVRRVADLADGAILETAAGTGNVTVRLARQLPPEVAITATDLNQPMLDRLAGKPGMQRVTAQQADALALPFPAAAFDAVVCQFGVMFFPDRRRGHAEAARVLKPGGRYVFNVWDELAASPSVEVVHHAMADMFPDDPPQFLRRTPFGYHDRGAIQADLQASGFGTCTIDAVDARWEVASVADVAVAFCQGTPLRGEIEARDPGGVERATDVLAQRLTDRFGPGPQSLPIRALLIEARR